jgi:hypothetical protein
MIAPSTKFQTVPKILRFWSNSKADAFISAFNLLASSLRETGKIPREVYESLARFFPQACVELAVLRQSEDELEIFLSARPDDDPYWPGQLHMPGTTLYALDSEETMWSRLMHNELRELNGRRPTLAFNHVTTYDDRERGACMHAVYLTVVEAGTEISSGQFYPLRDIPRETINHHYAMLEKLLKHHFEHPV